jgi:hypothetical protein
MGESEKCNEIETARFAQFRPLSCTTRNSFLFALSQIYHDGATRCGNSLSGEVQWAAGPWECELAHKTMNYVKLSRLNNITYNYCSE